MKKNNRGFIATSLIYSFFLIFISLFIAVISDYLQNKVLLETTTTGIIEKLNSFVDIRSFSIGDIISFEGASGNACDDVLENLENVYVVGNINYVSNEITLFSYLVYDSSLVSNPMGLSHIDSIASSNNLNNVHYNNILYSYDYHSSCSSGGYDLYGGGYTLYTDLTQCTEGTDYYVTNKGCFKNSLSSSGCFRRVETKTIATGNLNECVLDSAVPTMQGKYFYLNEDL